MNKLPNIELPNDEPPNGSHSGLFRTLAVILAIAVICSGCTVNIFDSLEDALLLILIPGLIANLILFTSMVMKCAHGAFTE